MYKKTLEERVAAIERHLGIDDASLTATLEDLAKLANQIQDTLSNLMKLNDRLKPNQSQP